MTKFQYLLLGYGLIWVALGLYLLSMNRRLKRLGDYMVELRGRLDSSRRTSGE